MSRLIARATFGILMTFWARPAIAQLHGLPVYFTPRGGAGITMSADVGRTTVSTVGGYPTFRTPSSAGGRVSLGFSFLTVTAAAGLIGPDRAAGDPPVFQHGFLVAARILRPPRFPVAVAIEGGFGAFQVDNRSIDWVKTEQVLLGLGVARQFHVYGMLVEPWTAGRVEVSSVSARNVRQFQAPIVSGSQNGYGSSVGVNFTLLQGLAVHIAVDWSVLNSSASPFIVQAYRAERLTVGMGVHYAFNLPFLPGTPLVSH